ncbi:hypothetical protein BOW53_15315 [Solemya pervernicosa gill symbiont]|uniref:histidine kinase n=2 Tax=Gammaproteobacteria incertae sedis TaxID=118884 RepID=A0A1T2L0M4_9GAMM|nr:hypothetical protein BOW53_15315 [Solemya pervernicosa gill symbiont]
MVMHVSQLQSNLINSTALKTAELYSVALTQFRSLYSSEVVSKASASGLDVTHDYVDRDNAIPLPATLGMKLGEEIGKHATGARAQLYSPYPFPWRSESRVQRAFEKDAWAFLSVNTDQSFSRFESTGETTLLRYATADVMQQACVDCHNTYPDTPKDDWQVGDVRGVLVISLPIDDIIAQTEESLRYTTFAYAAIGLGIVLVIAFVIVRLRNQSKVLQQRVEERTARIEKEIGERKQAMNSLIESEEHNRLLLDSAGDGIYGLDLNGNTTFINPAACKMLGYKVDELLGKPIHEIVHHNHPDGSDYPSEECPMYAAFTDGEVHRVEDEVLWRKDGSSFPIEYTSTPVYKNGALVGAVVTFNDSSERKKMERMKNEFISTVSHELRTPLTSIKGSLGLIANGQFDEDPKTARKMLRIAYENSERLTLLINDLLDINKIENSDTLFEMKPLNLRTLLVDAIYANQGFSDKYNVKLSWQPSDEDQLTISADKNRLIQVLSNLCSNAIKFSPEDGEVVISTSHDDKTVRISITDNGPGIAADYQQSIFEKFVQADSSDTRNTGGTGLGLAITKEIIERHGGTIGLESTPGEGASFYFDLPLTDKSH